MSGERCDYCDKEVAKRHTEVTSENGDVRWFCNNSCLQEFLYGDSNPEPDDDDDFADPHGGSALRAAGRGNPRNRPCPTCGRKHMLTPKDVALGYQCDICADKAERGID